MKHFLTLLLLITSFGLLAQEVNISGKVTDDQGESLIGATVSVAGSSTGTITDVEGNYSLSVPDGGAVLVFSYTGYLPQKVELGARTIVDVQLETDIAQLSEVVVIGYGTMKKSDLTGAVGSTSGEELQERPQANIAQALAGRVAGVAITQNSGRPGGQSKVRIRGNTSISLDNSPLYVVDGIIMASTTTVNANGTYGGLQGGTSPIDYLNPNDIESIEVLKDASATAIYGARGANGVVLVTTKRGSRNGASVSYDNYFSVGVLAKKMDVLNSEEFMMIEDQAYRNAQKFDSIGWTAGRYTDPALKRTDPRLFNPDGTAIYDTDWQDEVTQNALTQNHQLSITGGGENGTYGAFLGYTDEQGIMKDSWMKRYSARFVVDTDITEWLQVGGALGYNYQHERILQGAWVGRNMIEGVPMIPIKYPDGSWATNRDYPGMEGGPNPVQVGEVYEEYLKTSTILGNAYANITLMEGLVLRSTLGINTINQLRDDFAPSGLAFIAANQNGIAHKGSQNFVSWQFENYLTYTKTLADIHALTGMLGASWQKSTRDAYDVSVWDWTDNYYGTNNLAAGGNPRPPTSSKRSEGFNSYFGRVNYILDDKYLMTVTGRYDGSSKFGKENRFGFFPSAALAWRVSEENFFPTGNTFSNLKVRASYGETGNSNIPAYSDQQGLSTYSYLFGGALQGGIGNSNALANSALRWERTIQYDFGLELGLFQGRVALEADFYRKETTDMLFNAPVPQTTGFPGGAFQNIGSMENRGVEFTLNTVNIRNDDFMWESTFNIAINRNKVLKLSGGSDIQQGVVRIQEGQPLNNFWGWINLGTWGSNEADQAQAANANWTTGDMKLQDLDGDVLITVNDQTVIGNGLPDGFGSFINTVKYKDFELVLDIQFTYGNDIMWLTTRPQRNRQGIANSLAGVLDAWTPENQNTFIPQWRPVNAGYDNRNTTSMIYDGSFIRGRNLLFAYNAPRDFLNKINVNRLRIYTSVQNFFLLTEYPGYDPEASTNNRAFNNGQVNFQAYPRPTVYMIGMNLTF